MILSHLVQRRAVPDNLLFLVLMAILFWILSVHAGYHLIRYANPWITVLPIGIAIVLIHTYDTFYSNRIWYLVAYLFFALLLVARTVLSTQSGTLDANQRPICLPISGWISSE